MSEKRDDHVNFVLSPSALQHRDNNCTIQHSCSPTSAHGQVPFCKPNALNKSCSPHNYEYPKEHIALKEPSERADKTHPFHTVPSNAGSKNGILCAMKRQLQSELDEKRISRECGSKKSPYRSANAKTDKNKKPKTRSFTSDDDHALKSF